MAQLEFDRQARKATRRLDTRPSHDLADYAGDYGHPGYGRITITHAGDELHWAYRGMSEPLAHRHYDTFELPEAPDRLLPDRLAISFSTDREGNIGFGGSVRAARQRHRVRPHSGRRLHGPRLP